MSGTKSAKTAIEDYLNDLLLDSFVDDSVDINIQNSVVAKENANISESSDRVSQASVIDIPEGNELETLSIDIPSPTFKTDTEKNLAESNDEFINIELRSSEIDNLSNVSTNFSSSDKNDFKQSNDLNIKESSYKHQNRDESLSAVEPKLQIVQEITSDDSKPMCDSPKVSIISSTVIMPKLKLASGEEIQAKLGTDKKIKLNPSDFNVPPPPANWVNGRPEWGQNRFDCLLFKVMGLTLAVPLVELGGILRIEEAPKALFGQPDWFLGLMRANDENVYLVDTAKWVLPPNLLQEQSEDPYEFVIKIHNSSWGLCCNKVAEAISLEPSQVKWRGSGSKRPWLAGTVIKEMCALVDVSAFAQLLQSGHNNMQAIKV